MKSYPEPSAANDALRETVTSDVFEFPVAPDFVSHPFRIAPQAMLRRIEEHLPWRNRRPGEAERRLVEKVDVEFVL